MATTHDEYLANLNEAQRAALARVRRMIQEAAPHAEECISYQICAFRQGAMLIGYGATAKHCALFLMSNNTVAAHRKELLRYDTSTGTIRFQPDNPLPARLVKKLVKARLAENAAKAAAVKGRSRTSSAAKGAEIGAGKRTQRSPKSAAKRAAGKKASGRTPPR